MKITSNEIAKAQDALTEQGIVSPDGKFDSVFNGYISSFGASLVQAGLLPTFIFFENEDSAAQERYRIIRALKQVLDIETQATLAEYIIQEELANDQPFINQVARAMTAMKLALRMYKKTTSHA